MRLNLSSRSGMQDLLSENLEWADRRGYWGGSMMGWLYYLTVNFRVNYDNYRYSHLEEGPMEFYTAMIVSHDFPEIAHIELQKLALS